MPLDKWNYRRRHKSNHMTFSWKAFLCATFYLKCQPTHKTEFKFGHNYFGKMRAYNIHIKISF